MKIPLTATGDPRIDTPRLLHAISDLQAERRPRLLELSGEYCISAPLVLGEFGPDPSKPYIGNSSYPPIVRGNGYTKITWVGHETNAPMLRILDPSFNPVPGPYLSGVVLDCNHKCRGVRAHHCTYGMEVSNLMVTQANGVALDLIDCWGSSVRNVSIRHTHGIGLRAEGLNSGNLDMIQIRDGDGGIGWPEEDDTSVLNYAGDFVRTPKSQRAAMVIDGDLINARNLVMEGLDYGNHPAICLRKGRFETHGCVFSQLRFEGSRLPGGYIKITDGVQQCRFQYIQTSGQPNETCVVLVDGDSAGIVVSDVRTWYQGESIMRLASGKQSGHEVKRVYFSAPRVPQDKWIVADDAATIHGDGIHTSGTDRAYIDWDVLETSD